MKEIFTDGIADIFFSRGLISIDFYHLEVEGASKPQRVPFFRLTLPMTGLLDMRNLSKSVLDHLIEVGYYKKLAQAGETKNAAAPAAAEKKVEKKAEKKAAPVKKAAPAPVPAKKAEAKPAAKPAPAPAKKVEAKPAAKPAPAPAKKAEAKPAAPAKKAAPAPAPAKKNAAKGKKK